MTEPVTTTAATVSASGGAKVIGISFLAIVALSVFCAVLIVLMMIQTPRTPKEWAIGIITTIVFSLGLGATAIRYFELTHWITDWFGIVGLAFIIFMCGLPGWFIVRLIFNFMLKRKNSNVLDVIKEIKTLKKK
ncbi:hypothetical protein [Acinetobacter stercoris]|uniref:Bacteriophage protein n=1 Tax=Acinetobacter stercoris TaxID=2126983 RepID=A0A2U3N270_9GAMM|nr:hypothetical protein [Acinetobacter stercoris]SPL71733.1 hypothetical protein KPC_2911 [Acinetobacter stercoris]